MLKKSGGLGCLSTCFILILAWTHYKLYNMSSVYNGSISNNRRKIVYLSIYLLLQTLVHCQLKRNNKGVIPDKNRLDLDRTRVDWAYSIQGFAYLAEQELELYKILQKLKLDHLTFVQGTLIRDWLIDYEDSSMKAAGNNSSTTTNVAGMIDEISSHPFMVLRMIKRFMSLNELNLNELSRLKARIILPNRTDYQNVLWNVINFRYIYDLEISDLMKGKISTLQTNVGLTNLHAYDIALHAEEVGAYTESIFWLDAVLGSISNSTSSSSNQKGINSKTLRADIKRVSEKHDELLDSIRSNQEPLTRHEHVFTTKIGGRSQNDAFTKLTTLKKHYAKKYPGLDNSHVKYTFQRLCAVEDSLMPEKVKSQHYCYYETSRHRAEFISPLKIEILYLDPYIVRIYNVIKDAAVQNLINNVGDMSLGKVHTSHKKTIVKHTRYSMVKFLQKTKTNNALLRYLCTRIETITGLLVCNQPNTPISSEPVQVANYAFGGWFGSHSDALPMGVYNPLEGNRLATFMIYLNNVSLGGHTVFPTLGLSIQPIKSSAIFWFNLFRNGEPDGATVHGSCPILVGHKWITNSWIRSFANFQTRQCSTNPNE